MKKIIIIGGHGDGIVLASSIEDLRLSGANIMFLGFLNDHENKDSEISELPVLGSSADASSFMDDKDIFFMTAILKVKKNYDRSHRIDKLNIPPHKYFTLFHPHATVSKKAQVGYDTFIGPHANIMPNSIIGNHCSFRSSASVGHDCIIQDYSYMGPNSTLSGRVKVCKGVHIGPNASVREGVTLGSFSVIGIGAVVLNDIPDFAVTIGCPAKVKYFLKGDKNIIE